MSGFLGPLDGSGRIPSLQQTRVSAFLVSAHGALLRRIAFTLPGQLTAAWQTELHSQLYREAEMVALLIRATSWTLDPTLPLLAASWEAAWLPRPIPGIADRTLALSIDAAALGHAIHAAVRPAARLPDAASPNDAFAVALRRIEFESGRVIQAQIMFLKQDDLQPFRDAINVAVEQRHRQIRELWDAMLDSLGLADFRHRSP